MPTTALTATNLKNLYDGAISAGQLTMTMAAADASNGNHFVAQEKQMLIVINTDAVDPYTFSITSSKDVIGRTLDVTTYSLAAGAIALVLIPAYGYKNTNGNVAVTGSNAAIKFGVARFF